MAVHAPRRKNRIYSEVFTSWGLYSLGFAASSQRALMQEAREVILADGPPKPKEILQFRRTVATRALAREQAMSGRALGAQDVAACAFGGVGLVYTHAHSRRFEHLPVKSNHDWIADHLVFGFDPLGERHNASKTLRGLFRHANRRQFVKTLSALASQGADAIRHSDVTSLANTVNACREVFFQQWGRKKLIHPSTINMQATLAAQLGSELRAWKAPGAGSASSILLVTTDPATAIDTMAKAGWKAYQAHTSGGIEVDVRSDELDIFAPARIDLVGGADLGSDESICVDGCCLNIAIRPRNMLRLKCDA